MCWSCLGVLISSRTGILEEMLFLISHNLKICVLEMNKKWFTFSSELIDMNREKGRVCPSCPRVFVAFPAKMSPFL